MKLKSNEENKSPKFKLQPFDLAPVGFAPRGGPALIQKAVDPFPASGWTVGDFPFPESFPPSV